METSYLKTLELDKIIARAAEGCVCKEAREMLLATQPQCDPDEVRYALEQTDAINTLLIKNGSPRFGGVENVSQLAARAVKGGVLSMGELLMVAVHCAIFRIFQAGMVLQSTTLCLQTICSMRWHRSRAWNSRSPAPFWHRMPWQTRPLIP